MAPHAKHRDSERARAKVNLSLRVLGKRADGFHEIESCAAFADVCDVVEITHAKQNDLSLCGPFASSLGDDDNLVLRAMNAFNQSIGEVPAFECRLRKEIPVAAGLGGGSADAAAVLRLLARTGTADVSPSRLQSLAAALGSDVTVCLESRAAIIRGRGEMVEVVEAFPALPAILVNPGVTLQTSQVYAALSAKPVDGADMAPTPPLSTRDDVIGYMTVNGNDLESAAIALQPVIGDVLKTIATYRGCLVSRMSGSGPTCFGIFATGACADEAARALSEEHSDWWVRKTFLS